MTYQLLAATRRTSELVGREREMETIRKAVFPGDDSCQIVFIQGQGGFGKTRLLEETLRRLGEPDALDDYLMTKEHEQAGYDWHNYGAVIPARIVDMIGTRVHARNHFIHALRQNLGWAHDPAYAPDLNFTRYDETRRKHEQALSDNIDYHRLHQAAQEAVGGFLADHRAQATKRRLVWPIDTCEQLAVLASQWLIDKKLLTESDLEFQTQKWLAERIRRGELENTTLLLAGRDREGQAFFDTIERAAQEAGITPHEVTAEPFTPEETQRFFHVLATDWQERADSQEAEQSPRFSQNLSAEMAFLAESPGRSAVLHHYTGGQAVLLSIFADLIDEAPAIPEPLRAESVPQDGDDPQLGQKQWQIEEEFINLLFRQPRLPLETYAQADSTERVREATLRRDMLLALVRARRGLSAEQLHFLLDNPQGLTPEAWHREEMNPVRLRRIREAMDEIRRLSVVRGRPMRHVLGNGGSKVVETQPLGLQDEIYRIFAAHMGPHKHFGEPLDDEEKQERERLEALYNASKDEEKANYQLNWEDERREREHLYTRLRDWAAYEKKVIQNRLAGFQAEDERTLVRQLYIATPDSPRAARVRHDEARQKERVDYRNALRELDLEYMHYAFSLDPDRHLNDAYFDLADELWRANDEDADISTQAEMWRILRDPLAMRFVNWGELRPPVEERDEHTVDVLRRAARQEDASRWIKRFALRREYRRAEKFAGALEKAIKAMPEGHEKEGHEKNSWQHTFARGERACWREYARLLPGDGKKMEQAIANLRRLLPNLEKLANTSSKEVAISKKEAISKKDEQGFMGHPAHVRLRRVLSVIYANIAYGQTQLGHFRQAVENYGRALHYARGTGAQAHKALVLNNLSRALSEMGRQRALRICLDGLQLRQKLSADVPIGFSHNTLALIYNDQNRADRAWIEAAKAMHIFRRLDDPRGLGLALAQLGEALRRLAGQVRSGQVVSPATDKEIYAAANDILTEARDIFIKDPPGKGKENKVFEPLRWVEVWIESGCLYRDLLDATSLQQDRASWQTYRSSALAYLDQAAEVAEDKGWLRLALDARVNIAWTHYYAGESQEAKEALKTARELLGRILGPSPQLIEPQLDPLPTPERYEAYVFHQLSKIHGLSGQMAMDRFNSRVDELKKQRPELSKEAFHDVIPKDETARAWLQQAADGYVLGIAYAQLLSPRSSALSILYDKLYQYLKRFNATELKLFDEMVHDHYLARRMAQLKQEKPPRPLLALEDLGDLAEFLHESLGVGHQPDHKE